VQIREVVGTGQDFPVALEPVLGSDALDRGDDRTFDARHRVAPGPRAIAFGFSPPVRDSRAAGKRHTAVDDEQFAVRAIVDPIHRVPPDALIRRDPASGSAELRNRAAPQREAADGVDYYRDVDAAPRALAERVDEPRRDRPGLEDVALHVDRSRRAADGFEH